jgi:hypothetical protein
VATSCVAVGAGISAIASAGAATSTTASAKTASVARHRGARRTVLARAVHGELVLATKHGFVNVTFDRGSLQSVQGQQLTLVEGTKNTTQKTVTVTVPANAVVRNNGKQATLADLKPGERVRVVQGLRRTQVVARTPRTP